MASLLPDIEQLDDGTLRFDFDKAIDRVLDIRPALNRIAQMLIARARRSFEEQRGPDGPWLPRYPSQKGSRLNIAGAIKDLTDGPVIQDQRFDARPAGIDSGDLLASLTVEQSAQIGEDSIVLESPVAYAAAFAQGERTTLPITDRVERNFLIWRVNANPERRRRVTERLWPVIMQRDVYSFDSIPRPFWRFGDEEIEEATRILEEHLGQS